MSNDEQDGNDFDDGEHDPFNEPERAHPRARALMLEGPLWDCVGLDILLAIQRVVEEA